MPAQSEHTLAGVAKWLVSQLPQLCGVQTSSNSPDGSVIIELSSRVSNIRFDPSSKTLSFVWNRTLKAHGPDGSELELPAFYEKRGNLTEHVSINLSAINPNAAKVVDSSDLKTKQLWEVQLGSGNSRAFVLNGNELGRINLKYFQSKEDAAQVRRAFMDAANLAGASTGYTPDTSQ
ncbi:MAG TPA: hypothetical protein VGQ95_12135 [Chthoniobacterales bacterium]|nr:hypothetical protein [Chthoniobacterales bacterium]